MTRKKYAIYRIMENSKSKSCHGIHYNDVIMGAMASQIISLTIIYSTVYSRRRSKKTSKLRVTGLCEGNTPVTGDIPAQKASYAVNVSIWWRHHEPCHPRRHRRDDTMTTLGLWWWYCLQTHQHCNDIQQIYYHYILQTCLKTLKTVSMEKHLNTSI